MIEPVLTGGGIGGLILAVAYAWQQWTRSRQEKRAEPRNAISAAVSDATAANSLLLAALQEEREEVGRLSGRVQELETQNELLYEKIRDQRREYETEIQTLRRQVTEFERRLTEFQTRLRDDEREG